MNHKMGMLCLALAGLGLDAVAQQTGGAEAEDTPSVEYFLGLEQELGKVQVISASQQLEPLSETPVPVTVITREMIRALGARNLLDVLVTYVPGMTLAEDHNEINVAMRGVYASSQQKILILLDGHRLNSRAYSMAAPDYSIGLDKVKQIEVLRGPGSSLYGNVALTAVINIVTRDAAEVDGIELRVGLGNFGQKKLSLTAGKQLGAGQELMLWATYFQSDGEARAISAADDYAAVPRDGTALLHAIRGPGAYDVGASWKLGDFSMLMSSRQGSYVEPFTASGTTGEVYDYAAIRTLNGIGPGLTSRSEHLNATWRKSFGDHWSAEAQVYFDQNLLTAVLNTNPSVNGAIGLNWNEHDYGAVAQARYSYQLPVGGSGNLMVGAQAERMTLLDSVLMAQASGQWTSVVDTRDRKVLDPGSETTWSGFIQLKHRLREDLIFNLGVRYDNKDRHRGANVTDLSPRLAVIYAPRHWVDVKLSYSQAFVDAPYWYRYNSLASYRGAEGLTPEHLRSLQLTPSVRLLDDKLAGSLNLFFNDLTDFVYRNNQALPSEPIYQNAGALRTAGAELELAYLRENYRVRANATYQHVLDARDYGTRGSEIFNVPALQANLMAEVNPLAFLYPHLWFDLGARVASSQLSPIEIRFGNGVTYNEPDNRVGAYLVLNAGVRVTKVLVEGLSVEGHVYNLLDQRYEQGGATPHPYPQPGRWFLVTAAYQFDPLDLQ
ncbi:MAG: TonB-dependent receptor [Myxococcota bacterium]|nr:TonB-dependent receptor [Myxococcota bacterium]